MMNDEQKTQKLGNNAQRSNKAKESMAATSSKLTSKNFKLFDAILERTPKGQQVEKALKGLVKQGMKLETIHTAKPKKEKNIKSKG